jgi:hypothetical protein
MNNNGGDFPFVKAVGSLQRSFPAACLAGPDNTAKCLPMLCREKVRSKIETK